MISNKKILAFVGPSGCGKSTIVNELSKQGLILITPTYTERPPRIGEEPMEHTFISAKKFDEMLNSNQFLEIVQPFGLKYRYGLPKLDIVRGSVPAFMFRSMFVSMLPKHYPNFKIYQIEADYEFANSVVRSRGDSDIGTRLEMFIHERNNGQELADRIFINDGKNIETIVNEIAKCIKLDFSSLHTL